MNDRLVDLCRTLLSNYSIGTLPNVPKLRLAHSRIRRSPALSGRLSCLALIINIAVLTTSTSHAAFIEVERNSDFNCRVALEGEIKPGDFDEFADAIQRGWTLGCQTFTVALSSLGGNVVEAIKIGYLVRELAASTSAPHSIPGFGSCEGYRYKRRDGCVCFSACSLIWSAGVWRTGDHVYMHRPYFEKQLDDPFSRDSIQAYRTAWDITRSYLRDMNVPERIIEKMLSTSSAEGSKLSKADLQMMKMDPVYEELLIRECGSRSKKNPSHQSRVEQKRTMAHNQCMSEFHLKHSLRLQSNAQTHILRFKGKAEPSPR